jgi:hypothetical protein
LPLDQGTSRLIALAAGVLNGELDPVAGGRVRKREGDNLMKVISSFFGTALARPLTMMVTVLASSALPCSSTWAVLIGTSPLQLPGKGAEIRAYGAFRLRNRNRLYTYVVSIRGNCNIAIGAYFAMETGWPKTSTQKAFTRR